MKHKALLLFLSTICSRPLLAVSIARVVDKPGITTLRFNSASAPTDPNDAIVRITSSGAIVDFNDYTLSQESTNTVTGLDGIVVEENLTNVIIKNALVEIVSGNGVRIKDGCSNIRIQNLTVCNCGGAGIFLEGSATGTGINNGIIKDCLVLSCANTSTHATAARVQSTNNLLIVDSQFSASDGSATSNGIGLEVSFSAFLSCSNVVCSNNTGASGIGFSLNNVTNGVLSNCRAVQNRAQASTGSVAAGFYLNQCSKIICTRCTALENVNAQMRATGFLSESGSKNNFEQCTSETNSGGSQAAGFELNSESNSTIFQCASKLNETTTSGNAYGIYLSGGANNNCNISENIVAHNLGVGGSRGIVDDHASSTSMIIRNQAFNNGTNYAVNYPGVITLPVISGSLSDVLVGLPSLAAGDLDNLDITP